MHQINSNTIRYIKFKDYKKPVLNYPTNFAKTNYSIPPFKLNKSKYRISIRGSNLVEKYSNRSRKKATKE